MESTVPAKSDIDLIFNRLRSIATNKSCFDCGAKNPTWATVSYGVFICIDCSAVHRSLGVHLTFVRSTNLDTNWNWLQLRQMQIGGNANAATFFRQHNCNTTDAQQKYNSRAAQLYRDKLQQKAKQAIALHGTKLHLETFQNEELNSKKEEDFFADCENIDNNEFNNNDDNIIAEKKSTVKDIELTKAQEDEAFGAPSVNFLNSTVPVDTPKSTIGVRKIQPKKTGMGGVKKGLGATKVKTNFADIEQKANLADQIKETSLADKKVTQEEAAETLASVRLAYQDLSAQQHQQEEKLKISDPNKAKQMERLGMGFNLKTGGVSHSMLTDMQTLTQEINLNSNSSTSKFTSKNFDRENSNDFFDDYSTSMYNSNSISSSSNNKDFQRDTLLSGFEVIEPFDSKQNVSTMFSPISTTQQPSSTNKSGNISDQPKYSRNTNNSRSSSSSTATTPKNDYENYEAQKKFGSAKGISSDQYFGNEMSTYERSANLNKFQGSKSISSADYFDDGQSNHNSNRNNNRASINYNGPDLDDVKESVRQGVTKVAGRISTIANDVMSSLQDKYGY